MLQMVMMVMMVMSPAAEPSGCPYIWGLHKEGQIQTQKYELAEILLQKYWCILYFWPKIWIFKRALHSVTASQE